MDDTPSGDVDQELDIGDVAERISEMEDFVDSDTPQEEDVDEETEQEEVEQEPEYFTLKYDGAEIQKTKEELLELAQKGLGSDRRFVEAAEMRKSNEQMAQYLQMQAQLQQGLQNEYAQLAMLDAELQRYTNVDWGRYTDQDPVEATKAFQRYQILQQQRSQKGNELEQAQYQLQTNMREHHERMVREGGERLARELGKEWNAETQKAIRESAEANYGFTADELSNVTDPRVVRALMDAMKYRALQSQKPGVAKKVAQAPMMAKPGKKPLTTQSKRTQELRTNLKKSGSMQDAAKLLESML